MPFLQTVVARVVGFSQSKFHRFYDPNISLHVFHFGILEPYSLFLLVWTVCSVFRSIQGVSSSSGNKNEPGGRTLINVICHSIVSSLFAQAV